MLVKSDAALSGFAVHEIAGIKLNAGQVGIYLKLSAAFFVLGSCGKTERSAFAVDAEIVVISACHLKLNIIGVDIFPDFLRCSEIESRTVNRSDFARRNAVFVRRRKEIAVEHQLGVKNIAACGGAEVKIGMVGQVDDGVLVAYGFVMKLQLVFVGKNIGDLYVNVSGKALFAVGAFVAEFNGVVVNNDSIPQRTAVLCAAVKTGDALFVFRNVVLLAAEGEFSAADAVCILTDNLTGKSARVYMTEDIVKAGNNITVVSVLVGAAERIQCCASCNDTGGDAVVVLNRIKIYGTRIGHCIIKCFGYAHFNFSFSVITVIIPQPF